MSRSIIGRLLATIILLAVPSVSATAKIAIYQGPCEGGGNWTVVITIDDYTGRVAGREGSNCLGQYWRDQCSYHPVLPESLPLVSDYSWTSETSTAWVRWNRDATGKILRMWGMTSVGEYWEADSTQNLL